MTEDKILIIDDERLVRWPLTKKLAMEGYTPIEADTGKEGLKVLMAGVVDLILLDLRLPDLDGVEVLRRIKEIEPEIAVIMMTGFGSVESAVEAMKLGAFDFIRKPFNPEELLRIIGKALEVTALKREVRSLRLLSEQKNKEQNIIGQSPLMKKVGSLVDVVGQADMANVLLLGESGTGKNLVARAVHNSSPRKQQPFVVVTCTAMPAQLIESELFGYEKGAFTDAKANKKGLCEIANGGTLFLDEIGDMPLHLQAKLLGFIESQTFRRIGGTRDIRVNLRIIAATNKDLKQETRQGGFREDLFYRLNVFQIDLPPLRSRPEDIPELLAHFIDKFNKKLNKKIKEVSPKVVAAMKKYPWPGNIRELQNMIERSMILARSRVLSLEDFPRELMQGPDEDEISSRFVLPAEGIDFHAMERSLVRQALEKTNWNQTRAARLLGFTRDQMRYRVKQFDLN